MVPVRSTITFNSASVMQRRQWEQTFGRLISSLIIWFQDIEEPEREGILYRLITSRKFEIFTLAIIICNGLVILMDTNDAMERSLDLIKTGQASVGDDSLQHAREIETFFLIFYIAELSLKVFVHRMHFFWNQDASWNWLDMVLVVVGAFDFITTHLNVVDAISNVTFIRVVRLFKISKILRMFRVLKFVGELRIMLACLTGCFLQLFWVLALLAFLLALFAVFFVQGFVLMLEGGASTSGASQDLSMWADVETTFGSVQAAMRTLFSATTGGHDWMDTWPIVSLLGQFYTACFLFYIAFFTVAVFNVVTSVFLDKAMRLATPDVEVLMLERERRDISDTRELYELCIEHLLSDTDPGIGNNSISFDEFMDFMSDERFKLYFDVRGIDIKDAEMFFKMLVSTTGIPQTDPRVDLHAFVQGCMTLKGFASSIDLHTLSFEVKVMHEAQRTFIQQFSEKLTTLQHQILLSSAGANSPSPSLMPDRPR